jgi:hypothetical protein
MAGKTGCWNVAMLLEGGWFDNQDIVPEAPRYFVKRRAIASFRRPFVVTMGSAPRILNPRSPLFAGG